MRTPDRLWPVTAVPILLFVLITWQVVADGPLVRADERLSRALVHPDRFSATLSDLGNVQVAVPVLAVVIGLALWLGRRSGADRWWLPPVAAAVLMALVPAIVVPLKAWTDRPGTPVMPWAGGFYPSGHTATAAVAYGASTMILLPLIGAALVRRLLVAGCVVVNLGVGFGLVRRGYHWPLDVVASWCLCTVLLFALWVFLSRSTRRSSAGTPSSRTGPS
ncbi:MULTISPECIES: phosphatase PAP2 family protein [Streptomyces]|uniref:phosphatase PAP2 family protein n=1 Tax=Streptomyces herbicida TaxID=3065675 RepID=UPI00292F495D|nr:phosphatase PAP2 family protein [Streptomyces sp. NEAU-HV9]